VCCVLPQQGLAVRCPRLHDGAEPLLAGQGFQAAGQPGRCRLCALVPAGAADGVRLLLCCCAAVLLLRQW
jgi:hypothetical protein